MKKLILSIILFSVSALAQIYQQPVIQSQVNQGTSSFTCVFRNNVVTGDPLVAAIVTTVSITGCPVDTKLSSWSQAGSTVSGNGLITTTCVAAANGSGADTVTWTASALVMINSCVELNKNLYTTTVDVTGGTTFTAGATVNVTTAAVTPTVDQDFVYIITGENANSAYLSPQAPLFSLGSLTNYSGGSAAYKVAGTSGVGVTGTFYNDPGATGIYSVTTLKPVAMTIPTTTMPNGVLNKAYDYTLPVLGGVGAYTWSITSGSLFTGMNFNTGTGEITGTPTVGGTNSITFHAVGATSGSASATLSLTVNNTAGTPSSIQDINNGGSGAMTFTSVAIGDLEVVSQALGCATTFYNSAPTSSLGTVLNFVGIVIHDNTNSACGLAENIYAGIATSAGSDTINPGLIPAVGTQIRNAQPFYDLTVYTHGTSASTATITSGNITTVVPNSIIYAAADIFTGGGSTLVAVAPFTQSGCATLSRLCSEYNVESSAGIYAPSFAQTNNTVGFWTMMDLSLRPTTSGVYVPPAVPRKHGQVF